MKRIETFDNYINEAKKFLEERQSAGLAIVHDGKVLLGHSTGRKRLASYGISKGGIDEGESILDAAYKAGGDLPFACKGGVCCTCKAKILEGSARMDVNYALEPDEVEAGYILTCQAHPTSEKLTISFDD